MTVTPTYKLIAAAKRLSRHNIINVDDLEALAKGLSFEVTESSEVDSTSEESSVATSV